MAIEREAQTAARGFVFFRQKPQATETKVLEPGHKETFFFPNNVNVPNTEAYEEAKRVRVLSSNAVELSEKCQHTGQRISTLLAEGQINKADLSYRRGERTIKIRWKPTPSIKPVI